MPHMHSLKCRGLAVSVAHRQRGVDLVERGTRWDAMAAYRLGEGEPQSRSAVPIRNRTYRRELYFYSNFKRHKVSCSRSLNQRGRGEFHKKRVFPRAFTEAKAITFVCWSVDAWPSTGGWTDLSFKTKQTFFPLSADIADSTLSPPVPEKWTFCR